MILPHFNPGRAKPFFFFFFFFGVREILGYRTKRKSRSVLVAPDGARLRSPTFLFALYFALEPDHRAIGAGIKVFLALFTGHSSRLKGTQ